MLLAVEGGGFFSSSASGYSNGLALLLLGRKNEEKPLKVSPWNHYQLVEQEVDSDSQLGCKRDQPSRGCTSFICFGCTPARLDCESPGKVGFANQLGSSSFSLSSSDKGKTADNAAKGNERKACLKSNLKKPCRDCPIAHDSDDARELLEEMPTEMSCCTVTRKVQWTDKCGKDLVEIREFEVSDEPSDDDEHEGKSFRRCECVIQ